MWEKATVTRASVQDELRYCERCGISFLWSAEEQIQAQESTASAPVFCAGCLALLPAPGRERGLVKWFNYRKRFGFIVRQHLPELFVHGSDVPDNAGLRPGDLVEFSVEEGERGLTAKAVRVLARGEPPVA